MGPASPQTPEPRSAVITGASRGLGLASAAHLYALGWRVVGAMRSPDVGLERLRTATGAYAEDPRLLAVPLDLDDPPSILAAARAIQDAVGAPDVLVHNAGIAAFGSVEDFPSQAWEQMFSTNLFGPIALTKALLPAMRGAGRGRIVVVSSQGGTRGMPGISAYSASKGALERWAEALAEEIAPFGLGVTILVAGSFQTDILTEQTPDYGDYDGPYAAHYAGIRRTGDLVVQRMARPSEGFARALAKALDERAPFARHAVGLDAQLLLLGNRLLPGWLLHRLVRAAMRLPRRGALRSPSSRPSRQPARPYPGDPNMSLFDSFRFDGKRVVVVGGATGMGAAAAQLALEAGADVVVMDHAEVNLSGAKAIHVNLAEKASIDAAVDECGGPVHALLSCAGVADGTPHIEKINFVGHRHLIDRLLEAGSLGRGAAIGFISSAAGLGWEKNLELLQELLATPDFDQAVAFIREREMANYYWMKQAVCAYVASQAFPMLKRGIRINAICPGPTDTPLAQANKDVWLAFGADYREELGIQASTPLEQAYPLLFLCSEAASAVNGITLITDAGHMMAGITESFPGATMMARVLMGRS
jgi:NAD(P)-dependent dehydrogenase (short-subunit alcohol dehydrogenase family)